MKFLSWSSKLLYLQDKGNNVSAVVCFSHRQNSSHFWRENSREYFEYVYWVRMDGVGLLHSSPHRAVHFLLQGIVSIKLVLNSQRFSFWNCSPISINGIYISTSPRFSDISKEDKIHYSYIIWVWEADPVGPKNIGKICKDSLKCRSVFSEVQIIQTIWGSTIVLWRIKFTKLFLKTVSRDMYQKYFGFWLCAVPW